MSGDTPFYKIFTAEKKYLHKFSLVVSYMKQEGNYSNFDN